MSSVSERAMPAASSRRSMRARPPTALTTRMWPPLSTMKLSVGASFQSPVCLLGVQAPSIVSPGTSLATSSVRIQTKNGG